MKKAIAKIMIGAMLLATPCTVVEAKRPTIVEAASSCAPKVTTKNGYITTGSIKKICKQVGEMYDISPEILRAIVYIESRYKANPGGKTYKGPCQIATKYCKAKMKELGITDPSDPYQNIILCADILNEYREKHGMTYAIMAYNSGPGAANKLRRRGRTTSYLRRVYSLEKKFKKEGKKK